MAAECLWCLLGSKNIANPISGATNDPLGCCHRCQAFACGNHAQYDYKLHQYICYLCDINGIIKSAEELNESDQDALSRVAGLNVKFEISGEDALFSSYEDFKVRRPGYNDWFDEIEAASLRKWRNDDLDKLLISLNPDSRILYIAAAVILHKIDDGPLDSSKLSGYPDFISAIKQELDTGETLPWN